MNINNVSYVSFLKDRGRIEYKYFFNEEQYEKSVFVHETEDTTAYRVGQNIRLVIDKYNPKRVCILSIYT